jgi:hypothetical protein
VRRCRAHRHDVARVAIEYVASDDGRIPPSPHQMKVAAERPNRRHDIVGLVGCTVIIKIDAGNGVVAVQGRFESQLFLLNIQLSVEKKG